MLVLDRGNPASSRDRARLRLEQAVLGNRLLMMLKRSFCPNKIRRRFPVGPGPCHELPVRAGGQELRLTMLHLYRFAREALEMMSSYGLLPSARPGDLRDLLESLAACECGDRQEEIDVLLGILLKAPGNGEPPKRGGLSDREKTELQRRVLWLLRKFAHRKYREQFEKTACRLREVCERAPEDFAVLAGGLSEVKILAQARFRG